MSFYAQYPASSGSSSNASVGVNGDSIPSDSTLIGAEDGSSNLQPLQVDGSGNLKVSASSLPLPTGAATEATLAKLTQAQGSTTSGQSGPLLQAAATTAAGSVATGTTNPLNMDTSGWLRVVDKNSSSNNSLLSSIDSDLASVTTSAGAAASTAGFYSLSKATTAAPSYGNGTSQPLSLTGSGALRVDGSAATQPVSGTVAATQSGTWSSRTQDGSGNSISSTGNALDVNLKTSAATNISTNIAQVGGSTVALGQTTMSASMPVAIASNQSAIPVSQSGTWTPTMPTLAANGTIAATGVVFTAATVAGYGQVSVQTIITGTATITFEGSNDNTTWVAISMGYPTAGAPTTVTSSSNIFWAPVNFNYFRVRCSAWTNGNVSAYMIATSTGLSNDPALRNISISNTVAVSQSGTWTVQPGNTANSTAWLVNNQVIPQSGSTNAASSAASTALASSLVIKGGAGRLLQLTGINTKATGQYIQVFNATSAPADTTVPVLLVYVPSMGTFSFDFGAIGRYFATGITVTNSSTAATKTIGSADCWFNAEYL